MSFLLLSPERCVRALSVNSICTLCETICPVGAISITDRLPAINSMTCVGCAGCVAVCPSEALSLDDFNPTDFFFDFVSGSDGLISCQKNVPCIASMSAEALISLVKLKGNIVCDT